MRLENANNYTNKRKNYLGRTILFLSIFFPLFSFAQNHDTLVALPGSAITIEKATATKAQDRCTEWNNTHAVYSGRDIDYRARSTPKNQHQIFTKLTKVHTYGPINNLRFPFVSNLVPKQGTSGIPSQGVYIFDNDQGKYMGNTGAQRGYLSSQIAIEAIFRTINSSSTTRTSYQYFYTTNPNGTATTFSDSAFKDNYIFPTNNTLKACNNYYVAYCGDGIIDKKTGDGSNSDGQGGILKKDGSTQEFLAWYSNSSPVIDEVCDDGALNGQAGKCKTDCSGLGGDTPTGNLTVTKTLVSDKNYSQGENLQFKINFANNTTQTIQNITIEDLLPAGFEYISSEITGATAPISFSTGMVQGNFRIAYTGFSLSAGQAGYILINAKLTSCAAALNNVYWAGTFNGQSVTGYTNKQVTCSNTPVSITKSVAKTSVSGGESVLFTIQANNATPNAITNIFLQDIWPTNGCVFLTGNVQANLPVSQTQNGNMTQWTIPSLAAGQSITLTFYGQTKADASCVGTHTNTAKILYTDPSGNQQTQATATLTIAQPTQQMTIDKVVTQYGYGPKDMVVFEIKYKNTSSTPIYGFKITDIWPDSLDFVSADPRPTNTTQRPILRDFSSKTLQPQEGGVIKITGQIKSNIR